MKKLLITLFIAMCLFAFVGCKDTPPEDTTQPETPPTTITETFNVSFYNENGTLLETKVLEKNSTPTYSYSVTDTQEWDYTFQGWATSLNGTVLSQLPTVQSDASYYAIVSKAKQQYTVSFNTDNKTTVNPITVDYGTSISAPTNPSCDGFVFLGWFTDSNCTTAFNWSTQITSNITLYASWNVKVDMEKLLTALLNGYSISPYSFIPETMQSTYAPKSINQNSVVSDYSNFVNVSNINNGGFGEQWHMIIDNINQSTTFHNVLTVIDGITSTSISAFNNYLDENPGDTANYSFKHSSYNITIKFDGETMLYIVDYTATLPILGEQSIQIALKLDVESGDKTARIQLGDANAMAYTIKENEYIFAIKYLGVRRAYFSIEKTANGSVGHIYEYLTAAGIETESAADFYINDKYVYAIGNKADAFMGFTGYISETYDVTNGKLIGYEVEETLKSITYNTIWFELKDWQGINSIKCTETTNPTTNAKEYNWYLNGSTKKWETKDVGGLSLKIFSRRFDIEYKTQYYYYYDTTTETYKEISVKVPMLFIQEEVYNDFIKDVKSTNNLDLTCKMSTERLNAILNGYDLYVSVFKNNKDLMDSNVIVDMIGNKYVFTTNSED